MAQKPFISDMGIRLGDWLLTQNSDGDLTAGHVAVDANNAQRAFRADYGVKIGNWEMYADGDELSVTENRAMAGSQRPFIADAGFQISDWTFTQDTDGNMLLSTTAIVSSGTETSGSGSGDTGGTGGTEPAIEMDPSSPDFDHTNFNWAITTSVDVPNPPTGMSSTAYENGEYAQVTEGDWHTWTVTTDAPDGTQIYMSTSIGYVGTYYSSGDPSNESGISDKMGQTHGFKTVANGQITGSIGGYPDDYVENGEMMRMNIYSGVNGTRLARSQFIAIIDRP